MSVLEHIEYTGCTCNFKTYSKSYKLKKRFPNSVEDMVIFPNTQEAIIPQAQWDRVQDGKSNRETHEKSIKADKKRFEQAKKRLSDLDVIMSKLYEDHALGNLSADRYKKMFADYEAEQKQLELEISVTEDWVESREKADDDMDSFIALTKKM